MHARTHSCTYPRARIIRENVMHPREERTRTHTHTDTYGLLTCDTFTTSRSRVCIRARARVDTRTSHSSYAAIYEPFARLNTIGHGSFAKGKKRDAVAVINKAPYHTCCTLINSKSRSCAKQRLTSMGTTPYVTMCGAEKKYQSRTRCIFR